MVTKQRPNSFLARKPNPPAHELISEVPKSLSLIIARAMEPLPANRFPTTSDFAAALRGMQG